jgi:transposase
VDLWCKAKEPAHKRFILDFPHQALNIVNHNLAYNQKGLKWHKESVIRLHEEAFHELGAVPEIMTYDNMTTVGRHTGKGKVWINPTFKRFTDEYGFKIVILAPGAKDRHGGVERPFQFPQKYDP